MTKPDGTYPLRMPASAALLSIASAALVLVIYLLRLDRTAGLIVDDAWYVMFGQALARGEGYSLVNAPTPGILPPNYPPGFASSCRSSSCCRPAFPENVLLLKAVSIAAMMALGVVSYWYFFRYRKLPQPLALALAVATVITSGVRVPGDVDRDVRMRFRARAAARHHPRRSVRDRCPSQTRHAPGWRARRRRGPDSNGRCAHTRGRSAVPSGAPAVASGPGVRLRGPAVPCALVVVRADSRADHGTADRAWRRRPRHVRRRPGQDHGAGPPGQSEKRPGGRVRTRCRGNRDARPFSWCVGERRGGHLGRWRPLPEQHGQRHGDHVRLVPAQRPRRSRLRFNDAARSERGGVRGAAVDWHDRPLAVAELSLRAAAHALPVLLPAGGSANDDHGGAGRACRPALRDWLECRGPRPVHPEVAHRNARLGNGRKRSGCAVCLDAPARHRRRLRGDHESGARLSTNGPANGRDQRS